jgi:hypothetical protein
MPHGDLPLKVQNGTRCFTMKNYLSVVPEKQLKLTGEEKKRKDKGPIAIKASSGPIACIYGEAANGGWGNHFPTQLLLL